VEETQKTVYFLRLEEIDSEIKEKIKDFSI